MSDTYESIILLHGDEAHEAIGILDEGGEAAALGHLRQWHEPGEGTLVSTRDDPWKEGDGIYEDGRFVMYYNREAPYIGLVCKVSI